MSGLTNNPIELLVLLAVNSDKSIENINKGIKLLQDKVSELNIEIVVKGKSEFAKSIAKQLKTLKDDAIDLGETIDNIGKGKGKGKNQSSDAAHNLTKGVKDSMIESFKHIDNLEKYLKSKEYKYKIEMDIDEKGNEKIKRVLAETKNEFGELQTLIIKPVVDDKGDSRFKQVGSALKNIDKFELNKNIDKAKRSLEELVRTGIYAADEYKKVKGLIENSKTNEELEKVVANMKSFAKDSNIYNKIENTVASVNNEVELLNSSMDRFLNKNAKNADLSTFGRLKDELKAIQNTVVHTEKEAQKLKQRLSEVKGQITTATASTADLNSFDTKANQIKKMIKTMEDMPEKARITEQAIKLMYKQIERIPRGDLNALEAQFQRIERITGKMKDRKLIYDADNTNQHNAARLMAQLERTYNLNQRHVDKSMYQSLKQAIADLTKEEIKHVNQIDAVEQKYRKLSQAVSRFAADATQQSRNSMTLLNQLKVALERFPIWMIASTAFYGVVRTTRAFIDTLVEIDSKLVSIEKVAGSMDMASIFESAIDSAERYGQSISSVLDAYAEFARQGFKGQQLLDLSDAGLITANVGELDAQKASEYLTSTLIQWNMQTTEAMGKLKCPYVQRCA